MNRSLITPILSFALMFSFAANIAFSAAVHHPAHPNTTLNQTGGDPEPINPPGNGGH